MAVREIKTTIALDGEQKFKQAIAAASREMRVMDSELKAVTAAYENNGDAAAYYAQKQANLKNQISQQKQIIESLEQAVQDATKAYGAGSSQVDGYAIKLNNARTRMSKLEKQLEETDREVEELGRDSVKAGRQLKQGIGEGAEEAERDVKSLIQTMQQDISSIRTSSAVSALTSLWGTASSAFSSVSGFVDSTAELRRQMSFLEQNAETQGFDFDFIKGQMAEITTLTGDTSASIEGLSNLMAVPGMDAQYMTTTVELLAGAVASFPDTVKFESLADSLQETLATGEATGQFAELLGRMGVKTEDFNAALANSGTAAGDLNIAMAYLAENGMQDVYKQWQENNQAMIDASQTQTELEQELAEFGGTLEKYIVTPVKSLLVDALKWVNDTVEDWEEQYVIPVENQEEAQGNIAAGLEYLKSKGAITASAYLKTRDRLLSSDGEAITKSDIGYINRMLNLANASPAIVEAWAATEEGIAALAKYEAASAEAAKGPVTYDKPIGPPTPERYESAGQEAAQAYLNGFETQLDMSGLEAEAENAAVQTIAPVAGAFEDWERLVRDAAEDLQESKRDFGDAGEDAGSAFADAFERSAQDMIGRFSSLGMQAGMAYGTGLRSTVSYVSSAAAAVSAAAQTGLATARAGVRDIILQVDGREFARTTASYYDEALSVAD